MPVKTKKGDGATGYRWLENGHILLWLVKDTCWALEWKIGAFVMILPTVAMAFYLLWRSRGHRADVFHNIAVCLWILANSTWMTGEFIKVELRPVAAIFFFIGLMVLAVYYGLYFKADRRAENSIEE